MRGDGGRRGPTVLVAPTLALAAGVLASWAPTPAATASERPMEVAAPPGLAAVPGPVSPITATGWAGGIGPAAAQEWASDASFHPGITAVDVTAMAVAPDGDLVAGGLFYETGTFNQYNLVRLHPDGTEDTAFAHYHSGRPYDLAVQPSGGVLVAADVASESPPGARGLVRLDEHGAIDPTFADLAADAQIRVIRTLDDGRLVVGGNFTTIGGVARHGVAVLSADGVVDPSFADPGIAGGVSSLAVDADGSIVAVGSFRQVDGAAQSGLVRLDAHGGRLPSLVAPTLGGMAPLLERVAVLPDHRLAVSGRFTSVDGVPRTGFAVLASTGEVDESVADLDFPSDHGIHALHVDTAGRLLVTGWFASVRGEERSGIVRLLADGSLDPTFVDPRIDIVRAVVEEDTGDLLVGGAFSSVEGRASPRIARLLADGTPRPGALDPTFGDNGLVVAAGGRSSSGSYDVEVQPDGRIVSVGWTSGAGGRVSVLRLTSDGQPDPSFGGGDGAVATNLTSGDEWAHAVALQPDGRIVVAGHAGGPSGPMALLRYLPDGRLDRSFSGDGKMTIDFGYGAEVAYDVAVLANAKILVAGAVDGRGGQIGLARVRPGGGLDTGFGAGGRVTTNVTEHQDFAWSIAPLPGGAIALAGVADTNPGTSRIGTPRPVVARYRRDGRPDPTFDGDGRRTWRFSPGAVGAATAITPDAEGRLVVAGFDARSGGRMVVARLLADGATDVGAFVDMGDLEDSPWDVRVDAAGRVVVAGYADSFDAVAIARLGPTLSLDPAFDDDGWLTLDHEPDGYDIAFGLTLDGDGRIVVAGVSGTATNQPLIGRFVGD